MSALKNIRKPKQGDAKHKRKVSISTVVMTVILVIGLGIIAYPTFSDWWNSYHQSQAIANYVEAVEETDPKKLDAMLQAAQKYNASLADNANRLSMTDKERDEYNALLNLTGNGLIGYVQIPSIGVNLPVYHGVDETHLQVAIGHIEGTSLPIGGKGTHAAVSGHRGLPSAKLFSDLDKLTEGDTFAFTVLNQTITYEVDRVRIVEPKDLSDLTIDADKDYATLITCTPYGINTHRLLVRGHRIETRSDHDAVPASAIQIPNYIAIPAVAIPVLFVYLLVALIIRSRRRPSLDTDEALEAVRGQIANQDDWQEGEKSNESGRFGNEANEE